MFSLFPCCLVPAFTAYGRSAQNESAALLGAATQPNGQLPSGIPVGEASSGRAARSYRAGAPPCMLRGLSPRCVRPALPPTTSRAGGRARGNGKRILTPNAARRLGKNWERRRGVGVTRPGRAGCGSDLTLRRRRARRRRGLTLPAAVPTTPRRCTPVHHWNIAGPTCEEQKEEEVAKSEEQGNGGRY